MGVADENGADNLSERYCQNEFHNSDGAEIFYQSAGFEHDDKKLEEEFNATFLKRTNKGVVLTEAGEYFLERSKGILDTYFQMKDDLLFAALTPPPDLSTGETIFFAMRGFWQFC